MKLASKLTACGLLTSLAAASVSPVFADAQSDKNMMRNLAIGGAAVAAYGLLSHNNTAALLGAAGGALAGVQYEKDRKTQSQRRHGYYYYRGRQNYQNWNSNRRFGSR